MAHQGRAPFVEVNNLEFSEEAKEKFRCDDVVGDESLYHQG
jgi:hypothetical protein